MRPVNCRKYGHLQDAGNALVPNDVYERDGTAF